MWSFDAKDFNLSKEGLMKKFSSPQSHNISYIYTKIYQKINK